MADQASTARRRLCLVDVRHRSEPDGRCRVDVNMEWQGVAYHATREGTQTTQGVLRAAAEACLEAAEEAAGHSIALRLIGVKSVRAFDSEVIIASVRGETGEKTYRLLGCAASQPGDDPSQAATRAVLDALNRILEKYVDLP
jgi:hypothetical protein